MIAGKTSVRETEVESGRALGVIRITEKNVQQENKRHSEQLKVFLFIFKPVFMYQSHLDRLRHILVIICIYYIKCIIIFVN